MTEKIAVLLGGLSSEREISIKSGNAVYEALLSKGRDVVRIDVSTDPVSQIREQNADIAFIALHGAFGEDGTIQTMLDEAGIPYTGSGSEASRLAMDKLASKKIFRDHKLNVPDYVALTGSKVWLGKKWAQSPIFLPAVVKPNREGSSIGMSVAANTRDLAKAIEEAFKYDESIMIEEFIDGDDITVGILDEAPLPVIHIKPKEGIYDFNNKYTQGATEYIVPAQLDPKKIEEAQSLGLIAHEALGCRNFSRVDMRIDKIGNIFILEVNTIPGFTSTSLLPKAAQAAGIDFADMCLRIIESKGAAVKNG